MKKVLYTLALLTTTGLFANAQSENDVVINEFVVNPSTGREYVELLVTATTADLRGWTLSDVSSRTNTTGGTEGDFTLPANAAYLASVPRGTYIVIEFTTPTGVSNTSTLTEDTSLTDGTPRTLILKPTTPGVVLSGTIDNATSDNLHLFAGTRAAGTLIDQVLCGTNSSFIAGATWGDNSASTTTDNVNGGAGLPSNSAIRFVPAAFDLAGFRNNDSGPMFAVDASSYGTPGTVNTGVNDHNGTLPVTITSFTALRNADAVSLKWSTASESNNSHFEVQRSADGKRFETIGTVKGAGNSTKNVSYSYTDAAALSVKTSFYRLKQVDFDGKAEYSKMIQVTLPAPAAKGISSTLPNPFNGELNITIDAAATALASVEIMDMIGKLHYSATEQLHAGSNKVNINTVNMPDGIYFVRVSFNGETFTQKVIKK